MKITLETVAETAAIETELERARAAYTLDPTNKNAAPKPQHADGVSAGIAALPKAERETIATAIGAGDFGGGKKEWRLAFEAASRAKYPTQWQQKVNAIVTELRK